MMSYFKAARPTPFHLRRIHSSFICHTTLLFPSPSLRPTYSTSATQANAHWTVDHTGKSVVDLKFIEEPLGIPAQDGYGWPYIDFGESIGPNGRYTISRKLGFGSTSSIWLACDQREHRYCAIKALTGAHTKRLADLSDNTWEREAHKQLSELFPYSTSCLVPRAEFTLPGKGSAGQHLCHVMDVCEPSLQAILNHHGYLTLPVAKHISLHILRGIAHAHRCGVIHTDIKPDNIFMTSDLSTPQIDAVLGSTPPRRHPPETSLDGDVEVAVSQPLPMVSLEEVGSRPFVLADFGSARPITFRKAVKVTAQSYRAPEVILEQVWSEKVDIWSFGCLIFELIYGPPLIKNQPHQLFELEPLEYILYQMMTYLDDKFKFERLDNNDACRRYFDENGTLLKNPPEIKWPLEACFRSLSWFTEDERVALAKFIRRCLTLHPEDRASAEDLLSDPWFDGVV